MDCLYIVAFEINTKNTRKKKKPRVDKHSRVGVTNGSRIRIILHNYLLPFDFEDTITRLLI